MSISSKKSEYVSLEAKGSSQFWKLVYNENGIQNQGFNLSHGMMRNQTVLVTFFQTNKIEEYLRTKGLQILGYGADSSHIYFRRANNRRTGS